MHKELPACRKLNLSHLDNTNNWLTGRESW
jgi:hypothetical protein